MPSTALALIDEYEEVPVSSTAVLEASVAAIRDVLLEFKTEVRTALANINGEVKSLREEVKGEIKSLREEVRGEIQGVREEVIGEIRSLREKGDKHFERLSTRVDATNTEVYQLSKMVIRTDSKLNAVAWIWGGLGGLGGLIGLITTLGNVFHWF